MSQVRGSLEIARQVEVVFDVVADQRNEPADIPDMTEATKVTPGPIGVGIQFEATILSRDTPLRATIERTGNERPRRANSRSTVQA